IELVELLVFLVILSLWIGLLHQCVKRHTEELALQGC
ncbi:hypothetical protein Tco_0594483, partial [Tanacetum coccineum]